MRKIIGRKVSIILPVDLIERIDAQAKKENRSQAELMRRALDRYLLEQEFRGGSRPSVAVAAQETINENRELLEKLRNS